MSSAVASVTQLSSFQKVFTLIGTIIAQFALGSVYTWSLFNAAIAQELHVDAYRVALTFGLCCFMLALTSSQAGYIEKTIGLRYTTIISAFLMFIGLYIAAHATNLIGIYIGAGILIGIAEGSVYLMSLTNCVKIFPQKKGLISSLAVGAYGLGGVAFKYINYDLLVAYGLQKAFLYWGIIVFVLLILSAFMMFNAPQEQTRSNHTLGEVLSHKSYWGFAVIFLMTCMTGLYVIGAAKDIGESMAGLDASTAANAVAILTFFNLCGRLVMGSASDKIGTLKSVRICQIILCSGVALICYPELNMVLFFIAIACVAFGFGGSITVYPPLIGDFFGIKNVTKNYGFIYLGFGIGSVCGNVISFVLNGFQKTLPVLVLSMILALVIVMLTKNKLHQE